MALFEWQGEEAYSRMYDVTSPSDYAARYNDAKEAFPRSALQGSSPMSAAHGGSRRDWPRSRRFFDRSSRERNQMSA
jgi:hypothetical protein